MRKLSLEEIQQKEERKAYARSLYESGMTYEQIGETLGVSHQRVYQMIGGEYKNHFRGVSEKSCVFVGLRNWLNDNKLSVSDLVRRKFGEFHAESHERLANKLRGRTEFKKSEIDKLLEITGLTYEEAFCGVERSPRPETIEVVRCEDCVFSAELTEHQKRVYNVEIGIRCMGLNPFNKSGIVMSKHGFCYLGVRKGSYDG